VVASSLCGRTLADLILERESELTSLPWVGHRSPAGRSSRLRVVAQRLITAVLASADRIEDAGRGPGHPDAPGPALRAKSMNRSRSRV
jgi:hypothetical protein